MSTDTDLPTDYLVALGRWAHEGSIGMTGNSVFFHVANGGQAVTAQMSPDGYHDIADLTAYMERRPDLDDYTQQQLDVGPAMPAAARYGDPSTSAVAADSVDTANSQAVKAGILAAVSGHWPVTDERIYDLLEHELAKLDRRTTPQRVRTLRKELVDEGQLEQHDRNGRTRTNRPCRRWRIPQ